MNSKRRSNKLLIYAKKIRAIDMLGGKCMICGEISIHKLCFHHIRDKESTISELKYNRWSILEKEISKCQLLCNNCHSEFHHSQKTNQSIKEENKKLYLQYKGVGNCELCGYDRCMDVLQLHHISDKNFEFRTIQKSFKCIEDLTDVIKKELDICKVLCNNCHCELHSDVSFYETNKDIIISKSNSMRENSKPLNIFVVEKMMLGGLSVKEMMNILGCKKTAIYDMIKKISEKEKYLHIFVAAQVGE